jgi:SAM-dependent methyltransferase
LAPIEGISLHAGYRVVACAACGAVFADGIPDQAAFDRYYVASSRYEDSTRLGRPSAVDRARFKAIAAELAEGLGSRDLRVVEVGCSTGGLLAELRSLGFPHLLGVDPSPQCAHTVEALYGIPALHGTAFDTVPGGPWELLIAVGVAEHIRDLDRALTAFSAALVPGGLLYLEVPDLAGFHRTNEAPFQEFSTEHITFFTRTSLTNLLARHGFTPAFGRVAQRHHGGGSSMQVLAWAFRKSAAPAAGVTLEMDVEGPAAASCYRDLCVALAETESRRLALLLDVPGPFVVWGAGTVACRLMAGAILPRLPIAAFVDANPHLQGCHLGGLPIHSPAWLRDFPGPILVASVGYEADILRMLREELGLPNAVHLLREAAGQGI